MKLYFNLEDVSQVFVGSFVLAVPISFSEEAWSLSKTLPMANIALLFSLSIIFLAFFAYEGVFQSNVKYRMPVYVARIVIAYVISMLVVALVLLALDKLPILTEPIVALKRLIIIAMPASMGAIVVDGFDKE
ncbi:DUF2391 family protein [Dasania marina]|uniref:DUF2391 family protein n=1 Tax=Dasania marina TaxID=471499 RepID=UPI00037FB07A|nr:DUF2391 family protein [Dasania marina]